MNKATKQAIHSRPECPSPECPCDYCDRRRAWALRHWDDDLKAYYNEPSMIPFIRWAFAKMRPTQ